MADLNTTEVSAADVSQVQTDARLGKAVRIGTIVGLGLISMIGMAITTPIFGALLMMNNNIILQVSLTMATGIAFGLASDIRTKHQKKALSTMIGLFAGVLMWNLGPWVGPVIGFALVWPPVFLAVAITSGIAVSYYTDKIFAAWKGQDPLYSLSPQPSKEKDSDIIEPGSIDELSVQSPKNVKPLVPASNLVKNDVESESSILLSNVPSLRV